MWALFEWQDPNLIAPRRRLPRRGRTVGRSRHGNCFRINTLPGAAAELSLFGDVSAPTRQRPKTLSR
jgi:hypothetical protein